MLIKVTETHIYKARQLLKISSPSGPPRSECCPVALAIREQTGKAWSVGCFDVWLPWCVDRTDEDTRRRLSIRVQRFIQRFDRKKSVKPINFRF